MGYRVKSGRPVQHKDAEALDRVQQSALRRRDDAFALAMTFDPGGAASESLVAHAADLTPGASPPCSTRALATQCGKVAQG